MFKEPGSVSVFQIQTWIQKAIEYRSNPDSKHWVLRGRPSLATCGVERSTHSTNLRCEEVDPFYQPEVWRNQPILPTCGVERSTHSTNLRCGKVDPFYPPALWINRPILPTCGVYQSWHEEEGEEHEKDGDKLPRTAAVQVRLQSEHNKTNYCGQCGSGSGGDPNY